MAWGETPNPLVEQTASSQPPAVITSAEWPVVAGRHTVLARFLEMRIVILRKSSPISGSVWASRLLLAGRFLRRLLFFDGVRSCQLNSHLKDLIPGSIALKRPELLK
ncbi:hypothetical protein CEXT_237561 [Caerostris extrusa]|uniref:Uncharacterized protein n=1 Tax=Caerostris extrusa TaxID=172846 RepID=A0AAV4Y5S3_CAEEX|nr:hypothetical protein CEXT_237561 [Caerostris extrusa]